jgi:uncharacterized protein (TIGR02266 family)
MDSRPVLRDRRVDATPRILEEGRAAWGTVSVARISLSAENQADLSSGHAADAFGRQGPSASQATSSSLEDDRRRARRAGVTVRIDYATVDELFSEFTRDINEGGLFIETEKPHQPGTEVSMQFHLPGSQEVLCTLGRVVRVTHGAVGMPAGMGIEFDELTPDDRVKIDRIVRALRANGTL